MGRIFKPTRPLLDADGQPVLDDDGKPRRVPRTNNWFIRIYDHRGKAKDIATGTDKITEARKALHDLESKKNKHEEIGAHVNRITFDDAVKAVMDDQKANDRRATKREQGRIDSHLTPYFGGWRLVNITTITVKAYVVQRKEAGAKNATINRELQILSRAFTLAREAQQVTVEPVINKLDEPKQPRRGFFELAEFEGVREHLPEHMRPMLTFLYWTGWRLSEVLGLQVRQVNITQGVMSLDPWQCKSKDGRDFVFGPMLELRDLLTTQLQAAERIGKAHDKIIANVFHHPDGSAIKLSHWRKAWEAARTAAGYPMKQNHDFRRTAARNLERAGVSRTVAKAMIGHKTDEMYERYSIVDVPRMREEAEKLQVWATGQQKPAKAGGKVRQFKKAGAR